MSSHDININLNITISVSTDGTVTVSGVSAAGNDSNVSSADVGVEAAAGDSVDSTLSADDMRELAAPYKKNFVISKKELEELTKDEIIALGQGMLGIDIYKRQHKDEVVAEFWREYRARY